MNDTMTEQKEWFEIWFDSPYYHLLYKHRDESEAEYFLNNLIDKLQFAASSRILDLACGKGRHCIYLNKKGFDVTGLDISEQSINSALEFSNENLEFYLHDMRNPFRINYYDVILNLFTSFGYFKSEKENKAVIRAVAQGLKPGGIFVLDYFNPEKIVSELKEKETKTEEGIDFSITRSVNGKFLEKQISVSDKGKNFIFTESVMLFSEKEISDYLQSFKLNVINLYGDYSLNQFEEDKSERMIFIAQKI